LELIQLWDNNGRLGVIVYGWTGNAMGEIWGNGNMGEAPGAVAWQIGDLNGDGKAEVLQLWDNNGRFAMIEYAWRNNALQEVLAASNMGEWPGAVQWATGSFLATPGQVLQLWNNSGRLGAIVYGGFN
jgi:hypothetical protein